MHENQIEYRKLNPDNDRKKILYLEINLFTPLKDAIWTTKPVPEEPRLWPLV